LYYGFNNKNLFNKSFVTYIRKNFSTNSLTIDNISLNYILIADCINHKLVSQLYIIRRFLGRILKIQKLSNDYVRKFTEKKNAIFEFNTIPPKHFLGKSLEGDFIIRPKADGTLISSLNCNVFPKNLVSRYILKAEYIESKDLYLVFDINLPNKTPLERYKFLRSIHPFTKDFVKPYKIDNLKSFKIHNKTEDGILDFFLNKTSGPKWYPKASFIGKLNCEDIKLLTDVSENSSHLHSKLYPNDGFIVINNDEVLKIKPLDLMTIDITFNSKDNTWIDREGNNLSLYIKPSKKYEQSNIWRCYPIFGGNRLQFENR
jgi:hypothetical protein